VIAEAFVDGVELTVGVPGRHGPSADQLETPREFYDYEAKYSATDTATSFPATAPRSPDPESHCRLVLDDALGVRGSPLGMM